MKDFGVIDGVRVGITSHALSRLVEMELTADDIRLLVTDPEDVLDSNKYPGEFCHRRGDHTLAFVKEGDVLVIKTALYATKSAWLRAKRDGFLGSDREVNLNAPIPNF